MYDYVSDTNYSVTKLIVDEDDIKNSPNLGKYHD